MNASNLRADPANPAAQASLDDRYVPVSASAWRLALQRDREHRRLIYGAYEGALGCLELPSGQPLWKADLGGFPFAVATGDISGDGRDAVFAAAADGRLYAFGPDGEPLWTFASPLPLYGVAVAKLDGRTPMIVCGGLDRKVYVLSAAGELLATWPVQWLVHRLAAADLNGDGRDEVFVLDSREHAEVLAWHDGQLRRLWRRRLTVPDAMKNWENPRGSFFAFSVDIGDLDGDGRPEIILGDTYFNKQAVTALRGDDGEPLWISEPIQWRSDEHTWSEFYSTAFVRLVDLGERGRGVLTVAGGQVRLLGPGGAVQAQADSRLGFADLVVDGRTLYLGSSPNGDRTIYRIGLDGDWTAAINTLERQGLARRIGENLARLRAQVLAYEGTPPPERPRSMVQMFGARPTDAALARTVRQMEAFRRQFPYDNLQPTASMKVIEPTPPLDPDGQPWNPSRWRTDSINGTMRVEQILAAAEAIERHAVPTFVLIGHSCMPFITLETAERMLQAAPTHLVGFLSAEDEQPDQITPYLQHFFGPLADLAAKHGKAVMTKNKNVWWMSVLSHPEAFEAMLGQGRGDVLIAATEDSNSRTAEINLLVRAGLWQAGLIRRNLVSLHGDLFSFCRFHQWEYPKHGHPYLRLLVAHTLLGGTDYRFSIPHTVRDGEELTWTDLGRESTEIFLHMLGKGLVFPLRPEEAVGMARVGVVVHPVPPAWQADGHNGHNPWRWTDDPELAQAVIPHNGCQWGNSPTPPHALQAVLLNKSRQFGANVPATPYGPFVLVPASADRSQVPFVRQWWHTDGVAIWREEGERLTGPAAAEALRASFQQAVCELPFRADGEVFLQTVRMEEGRYRLYLIDPGWLDPQDRPVRLHVQLPGQYRLTDLLSNEPIPLQTGSVDLTVPAGSLRILQAQSVR